MTATTTDSWTFPTPHPTPQCDPAPRAPADLLGELIHRGARQMLIAAVKCHQFGYGDVQQVEAQVDPGDGGAQEDDAEALQKGQGGLPG